jgi:hypothetical protein
MVASGGLDKLWRHDADDSAHAAVQLKSLAGAHAQPAQCGKRTSKPGGADVFTLSPAAMPETRNIADLRAELLVGNHKVTPA